PAPAQDVAEAPESVEEDEAEVTVAADSRVELPTDSHYGTLILSCEGTANACLQVNDDCRDDEVYILNGMTSFPCPVYSATLKPDTIFQRLSPSCAAPTCVLRIAEPVFPAAPMPGIVPPARLVEDRPSPVDSPEAVPESAQVE